MQIATIEIIESTDPVPLPEPWLPAWREPDGTPRTGFEWSLVRLTTDDGTVGYGPGAGTIRNPDLVGMDPFRVGAFWQAELGGRRAGSTTAAGIEIALWDLVGTALGAPVRDLLGGWRDAVPVYAATSRLLPPEELAAHVERIHSEGFDTVKVRLHRPDPDDDVAAVRAVREAVPDVTLFADANQNNASPGYEFWTPRTARLVATACDDLGLALLEEPRPRRDVEGLADLARRCDLDIAGGEHSPTVRAFKPHVQAGAYDVLQPDVLLGGHLGISGLYRTAVVADFFDRRVIPHVTGNAETALGLAATLQVAGAVEAMPMIEYPYDPPVLTAGTLQPIVEDPVTASNGRVPIPDGPGLGVTVDEEYLAEHGEVVWAAE